MMTARGSGGCFGKERGGTKNTAATIGTVFVHPKKKQTKKTNTHRRPPGHVFGFCDDAACTDGKQAN